MRASRHAALFVPRQVCRRFSDFSSLDSTLRAQLDELLPRPGYFAVQVRNRLWRQEAIKLRASNAASRVVGCLGRWVPPDADVFFTADEVSDTSISSIPLICSVASSSCTKSA